MRIEETGKNYINELSSFINSKNKLFVLSGSAGTGKTTLINDFSNWLEKKGFIPVLLATTGRAAKILRDKTKRSTSTIHSELYIFDKIDELSDNGEDAWASESGQLQLSFDLKPKVENDKTVYIVDESSMISHQSLEQAHTAKFGSGNLLKDLYEFIGNNKLVFVGDQCQLPPVSPSAFSPALNIEFLRKHLLCDVDGFELTHIFRQQLDGGILKSANYFRNSIKSSTYIKYPKILVDNSGEIIVHLDEPSQIKKYVNEILTNGFTNTVMITNSNKKSQELNMIIKHQISSSYELKVGDILLVTQNSYLVNLSNGDQVELIELGISENRAGFKFFKSKVKTLHDNKIYETLLINDFIYSNSPSISPTDIKPLMIDFDQRMRNLGLKRNSLEYKNQMRKDKYLNALRVKFGYVLTCHKAQGGEWENVYLNIQKSIYGYKSEYLYRWFYTALTRASKRIHLNNGWWIIK